MPDHPLQLLVTNFAANDYVGRMAIGRIWNGTIKMGQKIVIVREEAEDTAGTVEPGRTVTLTGTVTSLTTAHGIERVDIAEASAGDIVAVAGIPDVTIGDTITDPGDPRPMPRLDMDAPTLHMTFGANTSSSPAAKDATSPVATSASASRARFSATSRSSSRRRNQPTLTRSAAAASCSWPS